MTTVSKLGLVKKIFKAGLICMRIGDISKCVVTSKWQLEISLIQLEISAIIIGDISNSIRDIFKYDSPSQNTIRDISNYNSTSRNTN